MPPNQIEPDYQIGDLVRVLDKIQLPLWWFEDQSRHPPDWVFEIVELSGNSVRLFIGPDENQVWWVPKKIVELVSKNLNPDGYRILHRG